MEGGIDRPHFIRPFQPRPGTQQQVAGGNTPNPVLKIFSKNSTTHENITILTLKSDIKEN